MTSCIHHDMDLNKLIDGVIALSRKTGKYMLGEQEKLQQSKISEKGLHDYVTHVDMQAEKMLVERLSTLLPGAGFLVEENTVGYTHKDYTWIVDPLDGTTNYIHALPVFSISIGLMHGREMVLGSVLDVRSGECFHAIKSGKAFCNAREIHVSSRPVLSSSLLATGFPYNDFGRQEAYLALLGYLMQHCRGIRRFGSAAIDLAWVACGRYDGFWEYNLKPWDVAAGSFILQQAGGLCTDFGGGSNYIHGKEIVAGNQNIHPELLGLVKQYF